MPGLYVCGWLKRGPTGIIGTNLADAEETVATLAATRDSRRAAGGQSVQVGGWLRWGGWGAAAAAAGNGVGGGGGAYIVSGACGHGRAGLEKKIHARIPPPVSLSRPPRLQGSLPLDQMHRACAAW